MLRKVTAGFFLSTFLIGVFYLLSSIPNSTPFPISKLPTISPQPEISLKFAEDNKQTRIGEIWEQEFERTKDPKTNTVPRQRLIEARKFMYQKLAKKGAIPDIEWTELGPNNVGGRTRSILFDKDDITNNSVFAAGVAGGLWHTTNFQSTDENAPTTWTKVNDFFDNLAITAVIQDPQNTDRLLFGTGEGWFNVDAVRGAGIYEYFKSTQTYNQLPNTDGSDFYYTQDLIFDLAGNLYAGTREGLKRTSDNGTNWVEVISGSMSDLEIAANGDLYASRGIFSPGDIFKSSYETHQENVGIAANWETITPAGDYSRIELATAPSDKDILYAICQGGENTEIDAAFRSDDQGSTWETLNIPSMCDQGDFVKISREGSSGQAWYDLIMVVDPNNPMRVYAGGIDAARSDDGGLTWTQISSWTGGYSSTNPEECVTDVSYVHADLHAMVIEPGTASNLVIGSDGGIFRTTDASAESPTFTEKNTNFNITQFYACAIHPTDGNHLAGAQDNGTQRFTSSNSLGSTTRASGGDGAFCHIDEDEPQYQFTQFTRNNVSRSTNGGLSFNYFFQQENGKFINPSDYDSELNHLYLSDSNNTYQRILNAPFATNKNDQVEILELDGSSVFAILVDPTVSDRIWLGGFGTGKLVRVDGASTDTPTASIMTNGLPSGGVISCIAISERSPQRMLVTFSNFGVNSIWESIDGGANWSSVEGNLPDMPVRWIIFNPIDPDQALIATELGVWSTDNLDGNDTDWEPTNVNLANVRVDMLQYRNFDNLVLAATHGRGMFATDAFDVVYIEFDEVESVASETVFNEGSDNNNCNANYRDYNIPVSITEAPVTAVNIIADIAPTSTADAQDYDLNSSTLNLTFEPDGPLVQNITLRLKDDVIIEDTESIELVLSIDNPESGVILGIEQSHLITVQDNDIDPFNESIITIFSEDWEDDLSAWNVSYPLINDPNSENYNGWAVTNATACQDRLLNSKVATIANFCLATCGAVYCDYFNYGYPSDVTLYREVDATDLQALKVYFDWFGKGGDFDFATLVYSTDNGDNWNVLPVGSFNNATTIQNASINLPESLANSTFLLGWRWTDDGDDDLVQPGFTFDNILTTGQQITEVATTINDSKQTYLKAGETAHFYNDNGDIIASVSQTSGADIGCITATIEESGTGRTFNNNLNGYTTERTISFLADSDAPYEVTLYYNQTELADWEDNATKLNIVKSEGRISNATEENSQLLLNNDLTVSTLTNLIAYKGNFTSFSSFALTDAGGINPLPVELLSFTGEVVQEGHLLNWKIATEQDLDYFEIEWATDGKSFVTIGEVASKPSFLSNIQNFDFINPHPAIGNNYYRLRQVDHSGKETFSKLILLQEIKPLDIEIHPNPTTDQVFIKSNHNNDKPLIIKVINNVGQNMHQVITTNNKQVVIDVSQWVNSIYYIQLQTGSTSYIESLVVQH